ESDEECAPAFDNYRREQLPVTEDGGAWMRLIAGTAFGLVSPVRAHSPLFYAHVVLQPGGRIGMPGGHAERAAYVARGRVETGGQAYAAGRMLVFGSAEDPVLAAPEGAILMLLGGAPLGERF